MRAPMRVERPRPGRPPPARGRSSRARVRPSASAAAIITFSVPVTVIPSKVKVAPRSRRSARGLDVAVLERDARRPAPRAPSGAGRWGGRRWRSRPGSETRARPQRAEQRPEHQHRWRAWSAPARRAPRASRSAARAPRTACGAVPATRSSVAAHRARAAAPWCGRRPGRGRCGRRGRPRRAARRPGWGARRSWRRRRAPSPRERDAAFDEDLVHRLGSPDGRGFYAGPREARHRAPARSRRARSRPTSARANPAASSRGPAAVAAWVSCISSDQRARPARASAGAPATMRRRTSSPSAPPSSAQPRLPPHLRARGRRSPPGGT